MPYTLQTDWQGSLLRLSLALFVGALIGWERQREHKPAGLRTHMLVSFGAAMFVLTGVQIGAVDESPGLVSRIIQGITAGIGFLGAGEIINKPRQTGGIKIQGLTSAAAIWVSASLGVAAACGLWQMALFGAIATFLILFAAKQLEDRL
jgi:putative Mg2+ transporter-C (MgtC) family protein